MRIRGEGYIQARKNPGGYWQLYYRGTRNEIYPGMKFKSSCEARNYWKTQKLLENPETTGKPDNR